MKQGRANTDKDAGHKREPIAHAVNPGAVAELGTIEVRSHSVPLYAGRGLEAPMQGSTIHQSGSQGKHK